MEITKQDIEKGIRHEERNEAMNLMNSAQKANSKAYNKGYDKITWGPCKRITEIEYYSYLHINGSIHVKRYFGDRGDLDEAIESDFVAIVVGPFVAKTRTDAQLKARKLINENN